jgi:hypothetical protein
MIPMFPVQAVPILNTSALMGGWILVYKRHKIKNYLGASYKYWSLMFDSMLLQQGYLHKKSMEAL